MDASAGNAQRGKHQRAAAIVHGSGMVQKRGLALLRHSGTEALWSGDSLLDGFGSGESPGCSSFVVAIAADLHGVGCQLGDALGVQGRFVVQLGSRQHGKVILLVGGGVASPTGGDGLSNVAEGHVRDKGH